MQRYAVVGQEAPRSDLNVRYIVGDPSTTVYWTAERSSGYGVDLSQCPNANIWRYGFDRFTGTAQGLKSPEEYFAQYIKRQVIFMIGYQDTTLDGDEGCEAQSQVSPLVDTANSLSVFSFRASFLTLYSLLSLSPGRSIP